jgi:hypothetical protein
VRKLSCILALCALLSCDSPAKVTEIVVVVDSDIALDRVQIRVFDHDGHESASRVQDFRVATNPGAGQHSLPLSFALTPEETGSAPSFRLVVTGYGGRDGIVEQQIASTFERERSLRLEVFLMSWCSGVICDQPTNGWLGNFTCAVESGTCGPLADNIKLPEADLTDKLAGYNDNRRPSAPPKSPTAPDAGPREEVCSLCSSDYPCAKLGPEAYTCLGRWADWPMPDPTPGARTAPSYDLSTPDVVKDNVTGLLWQQNPPPTYEGCSKQIDMPGDACSKLEANDYCARLDLANQKWRLPGLIELQSLFNPFQSGTFINRDAFPGSRSGPYWSRSPIARESGLSWWAFNFGDGDGPKNNGARVRCVSGVPQVEGSPEPRYFYDLNDASAYDDNTKLTWDLNPNDEIKDWHAASQACDDAANSRRLPSLNELTTLVDYTSHHPAIDTHAFSKVDSAPYWSSSAVPGDDSKEAWAIDFEDGTRVRVPITEHLHFRCVH